MVNPRVLSRSLVIVPTVSWVCVWQSNFTACISLATADFTGVAFCSWCLVSRWQSHLCLCCKVLSPGYYCFLLTTCLISTRVEKSRMKCHTSLISSVQQSELAVVLRPGPIFHLSYFVPPFLSQFSLAQRSTDALVTAHSCSPVFHRPG